MITWLWRSFDEMSNREIYDVLALRQKVFIIEQNCFYQDIDHQDQFAKHLLGYKNNKLIAYLRLFPQDARYSDALCFGRFLIAKEERGNGLAKQAMQQLIDYVKKNSPISLITISAQLYLKDFYALYGLKMVGEPYDEDGVPHVKMSGELIHCQTRIC